MRGYRSSNEIGGDTLERGLIEVYVGVDDTDEFIYGCSTNLLREFIKEIISSSLRNQIIFGDYPYLTRLNPSIPFKTRGNGAVSLHLYIYEDAVNELIEIIKTLLSGVRQGNGAEPGVVIVEGNISEELLRNYYIHALTDIVYLEVAERLINRISGRIISRGRGIIGALASIAHQFIEHDCTYEILGYSLSNDDVYIDPVNVYLMDKATRPLTFNNIDPDTNKILITPRIGRPVVLGIRGEDPKILLKALNIVKPEGVDEYLIFKTNQGTDQHLIPRDLVNAKPYRTGLFEVVVAEEPIIMRGGDIFLDVTDPYDKNVRVRVAIYREFGEAREIVKRLVRGDLLMVGGSVKPVSGIDGSGNIMINAELIKILRLAKKYRYMNPICPRCGSRMTSRGVGKGFKCPRCGYIDTNGRKILLEEPRIGVEENMILKPPIRNMKHLSKPLQRYGREKICVKRRRQLNINKIYIKNI